MAELKNDSVWVLKGTLHYDSGGALYIEINAEDCDVIKMSHGK
ncbi:NTF2 fold immunity protein [Flavobacterium beibuense]